MIVRHLPAIEAGEVVPVRQEEERATYAPMLSREMGEIDWTMPAAQIERRLRGMLPWPGAYTRFDGHVLKIWKAQALEQEVPSEVQPGAVLYTDKKSICVAAGEGVLSILEVQAEGKKRMGADAFLRGTRIPEGIVLG